jgi:hypothetical protein
METPISVVVVRPYVLLVTFDDGVVREVDMEPVLWGPVFEPLKDPAFFAQAFIDPELGTVVWPNGADVAPEFLYYGDKNPYAAFLESMSTGAEVLELPDR